MKAKAVLRGDATGRILLRENILEDVHTYRVNRHTFTIFVGSDPGTENDKDGMETGVDWRMANRFEINLDTLSSINAQRPILVVLSTAGGEWTDGMQMFSAILMCPNPVTVLAAKDARSMSSIIPLAADRFVMRPPAKYMFHRGSYSFDGSDHAAETDNIERLKLNEMMLRLYVARLREQGAHRRSSDQRIREMLLRRMGKECEVWLSAEQAVQMGFADGVFDGDLKKLRAQKKNLIRRQRMLDVLAKPINVTISVSA